jgi:hypothetical protein
MMDENEDNYIDPPRKIEEKAQDVLRSFGTDYKEPSSQVVEDSSWDEWARTIEFKVSRQGQLIIGVAVGTVVALGLGVLNGRLVIKLIQGHGQLVQAINPLLSSVNGDGTQANSNSRVSYSAPSKSVDTTKAGPVDEDLMNDLKEKLETSTAAEIPPELT